MRLHADGARRLQRGARARRFRRTPLHGHDRGRRLAEQSGPRLAARHWSAHAHPRAGERARLFLRSQSGRNDPSEGLRGPDIRPHRAQRRPDRHRDRQPPGGAGLASRRAAARGSPRARSCARRRWIGIGGRADARHAFGRIAARARAKHAARHRRRPDDVQISYAVGRQVLRRHGDGAACRPSVARHGNGAVPSDGTARRRRHAHDRHRARRGLARFGRLAARRRGQALHVRLRCARRTGDARHRQPLDHGSDPERPRESRTAACSSRWVISGRTRFAASSRAWSSAARIAASILRQARSK